MLSTKMSSAAKNNFTQTWYQRMPPNSSFQPTTLPGAFYKSALCAMPYRSIEYAFCTAAAEAWSLDSKLSSPNNAVSCTIG
jgi:hypothetical protein